LTFLAGVSAILAIGFVEGLRIDSANLAEIGDALQAAVYDPTVAPAEQAEFLARNRDVQEGLAERSIIQLQRQLGPQLERLRVSTLRVVLPDGTPFFELPGASARGPLLVSRVPIEYELRQVGFLEYGTRLTEPFVAELARDLATPARLFAPDGRALFGGAGIPAPEGVADDSGDGSSAGPVSRLVRTDRFGYMYLRQPGEPPGPLVAILGFLIPANAAAAGRLRVERNILWALTVAVVLLVTVRDLRQRRAQIPATPAAQPFTAIANPYIVGNPIRSSEMFFGRQDDFAYLQQKLSTEGAGLVLVLCGERRSGKTSILFQILNGTLGPRFLPVLIDMQYFAAVSGERELYRSIYREIVRVVFPEREHDDRLGRFDGLGDAAGQAFERVLDEAMAVHPDKSFLLLFDEYELIEAKIEQGELSGNVIPFLAGLLERSRRLAYIFTGSKNLEDRSSRYWRIMLGKSLYRKVSYLTRDDTERLVRQPVAGQVTYPDEAVSAIYRLTSGQPFYTQVICQNLVDHLNHVSRVQVTRADVETIVGGIVDNPLPQMIYFWDSLPPLEHAALALLAGRLDDERGWASSRTLLAAARTEGVPLAIDEPQLEVALEGLFDRELLARSEDRAFQYRMDLLRHWIRRAHSIWQIVKEEGDVLARG
jgi:AAA+ ATPase superfamily predicted ATPase